MQGDHVALPEFCLTDQILYSAAHVRIQSGLQYWLVRTDERRMSGPPSLILLQCVRSARQSLHTTGGTSKHDDGAVAGDGQTTTT